MINELSKLEVAEFESYLTEQDPTGRSPHEAGAKLDMGKSPVYQGIIDYFPRALAAVADVSAAGAAKYAWKGWESVPDGYYRYKNAQHRHALKKSIEGPYDQDFKKLGKDILHDAQEAWNALAALELYLREIEDGREHV